MDKKTLGTTLNYKVVDRNPQPFKTNLWDTKAFVPFGSDNLFPQSLALFSRTSPNHRGVINGKMNYLPGKEITSEDTDIQKNFIERVNNDGESLHEVVKKLIRDDQTGGNNFIEVITDMKSFVYLNHIDFTKVRKERKKERVIIHPDWSNFMGMSDKGVKILPLYPKWTRNSVAGVTVFRSVYHHFRYEPEFTKYGLPTWIAGQDSVKIDLKTNKWNLSRIENGFSIDGIIFVPVAGETEGAEVIKQINTQHRGEGKQGGAMVATVAKGYGDDKGAKPEFIQVKDNADGSWMQLHTQSLQDILVSHGWYRALTSLPDNTGFDTQRILNEYQVALATAIKPYQDGYKKLIQKIWRQCTKREIDFDFVNESPLKEHDFKRIWEVRRDKGMDYDENDISQQDYYINGTIHNSNSGGNSGI